MNVHEKFDGFVPRLIVCSSFKSLLTPIRVARALIVTLKWLNKARGSVT